MDNGEIELGERKVKILDAIIRNYLATGEPVGSRTISKYTDLNLSSATIAEQSRSVNVLQRNGVTVMGQYTGTQTESG